jgi:hypothetical protein
MSELTNEQAGELFKAIIQFQSGAEPELSQIGTILFHPFRKQFERDHLKYDVIVERNRLNGQKGGRPITQNNPEEPSGLIGLKKEPKLTQNNHKNKNDSKNKNKKDNKDIKTGRFAPPSVDDVVGYSKEKKLNLTGFHDYYESNGWLVGKNKMKNWKASARGWSSRQATQYQSTNKPSYQQSSGIGSASFKDYKPIKRKEKTDDNMKSMGEYLSKMQKNLS